MLFIVACCKLTRQLCCIIYYVRSSCLQSSVNVSFCYSIINVLSLLLNVDLDEIKFKKLLTCFCFNLLFSTWKSILLCDFYKIQKMWPYILSYLIKFDQSKCLIWANNLANFPISFLNWAIIEQLLSNNWPKRRRKYHQLVKLIGVIITSIERPTR